MYGRPDIYGGMQPVYTDAASHAGDLALNELYGATGGPGGFPDLGGAFERGSLFTGVDEFLDDPEFDDLFDDEDDDFGAFAPQGYETVSRDSIGGVSPEEYAGLMHAHGLMSDAEYAGFLKALGTGLGKVGKGIGQGVVGIGKGVGSIFKKRDGGGGGKKFKPFAWMKKKDGGSGDKKKPFAFLKRDPAKKKERQSDREDRQLLLEGDRASAEWQQGEARLEAQQLAAAGEPKYKQRLAKKEAKLASKARRRALKRSIRDKARSEFEQDIAAEVAQMAAPPPEPEPDPWSMGYLGASPIYPRTPPGTVPALDPADYANPYDTELNIYPGRYLSR
jgi:hypothetical protein